MILNTREFTVNGQKIIMGHDQETGKRYYCQEISDKDSLDNILPWDKMGPMAWEQLKSIFWIE